MILNKEQIPKPSDLYRFINLYKSFDIDCVVDKEDDRFVIKFSGEHYNDGEPYTDSEKFEGYNGFYSIIIFDSKGKFIAQGFYE